MWLDVILAEKKVDLLAQAVQKLSLKLLCFFLVILLRTSTSVF